MPPAPARERTEAAAPRMRCGGGGGDGWTVGARPVPGPQSAATKTSPAGQDRRRRGVRRGPRGTLKYAAARAGAWATAA